MNIQSRSLNSLINTIVGSLSQIIVMLVAFISRTIFIKILGAEYLGINGLYTNILNVISVAELGIGNVMIYSLYKPFVDQDEEVISKLLMYYRKIYWIVAITILTLGVSFIPFMDKVVTSDLYSDELILYYVLFLGNSVSSYFLVYKASLIDAGQKNYIIKTIHMIVTMIKEVAQVIILIMTKSYLLYLIVLIINTIVKNILVSKKADKLYPFIKEKRKLGNIDTLHIWENIKSSFLYRIGVTIMNNTDNILISILVGTIYVGYYSNYGLIISTVNSFITIVIQGIFSSIGNLNADDNMNKSYRFFNVLLLFFHWVSAFCSISFLLVLNNFVSIWIGEGFVLNYGIVWSIVINFYLQNIINPAWIYIETMGMFKQIKYIMLICSGINISLSVVLGIHIGIAGVLISTAMSRILTTVWYEPKILYNLKFKQPLKLYWFKQLKYFFTVVIASFVTFILVDDISTSIVGILLKVIIGFTVMTIAFFVSSYKSEEFIELKGYFIRWI